MNVKKLTVSSEKDKYGIHLKAEPDNQTLGRRLKGAFKQVSQAIKGKYKKNIKPNLQFIVLFTRIQLSETLGDLGSYENTLGDCPIFGNEIM